MGGGYAVFNVVRLNVQEQMGGQHSCKNLQTALAKLNETIEICVGKFWILHNSAQKGERDGIPAAGKVVRSERFGAGRATEGSSWDRIGGNEWRWVGLPEAGPPETAGDSPRRSMVNAKPKYSKRRPDSFGD